eukprot:8823757-Alexandrium_andersonii.AAC.1
MVSHHGFCTCVVRKLRFPSRNLLVSSFDAGSDRTVGVHWILPLHKRLSVHDPRNYRSIQLTSQIEGHGAVSGQNVSPAADRN